jgi:hypothetical protein
MKYLFFTLTILVFSTKLFAQEGYKEGFVLLTTQDTLFGYIEDNSGYENSLRCNYKNNIDEKNTVFAPGDILGYWFNDGKYYVSKEFEGQMYFFEYLIDGKLMVFSKIDRDLGNHYYIEKDTLPFVELKYKSEIKSDEDGIQRITRSKTHNLLLSYYTGDYPGLRDAAMSIEKPDNNSLIRFAREYHNAVCNDYPCIIYQKRQKRVIELEFVGGISHIFTDTASFVPGKTFPSGGVLISTMASRVSESIYWGTGLTYYQYPEKILVSKEFLYTRFADSIFKFTYETRFKSNVQIPITVYYDNHRPGISPMFGLSTNILHLFDFKAFCGVNYQVKLLAVKLYGEYNMFPAVTSYLKSAGVKIGVSYLIKQRAAF